jgi:hypothetical protein
VVAPDLDGPVCKTCLKAFTRHTRLAAHRSLEDASEFWAAYLLLQPEEGRLKAFSVLQKRLEIQVKKRTGGRL